jgi:cytochrome c
MRNQVVAWVGALAVLGLAAPASAQADGAKLFASRCSVCHFAPGKSPEQPRMGPSLSGLMGRKAGSHPKFTRYSKAMKAYGKPWADANLDAFLENPRKAVPGTNMAFVGLKKPEERAAIIAYLKSARPAR